MNVQQLLWLEALKARLWRRNPFRQLGQQCWYALTDIPLLWAARQELREALQAEANRQHTISTQLNGRQGKTIHTI
jgi:hypothetical protein